MYPILHLPQVLVFAKTMAILPVKTILVRSAERGAKYIHESPGYLRPISQWNDGKNLNLVCVKSFSFNYDNWWTRKIFFERLSG